MKKKIFNSVFATVVISIVAACVVFFIYIYNMLRKIYGDAYQPWQMTGELVVLALLILIATAVLAIIVATRVWYGGNLVYLSEDIMVCIDHESWYRMFVFRKVKPSVLKEWKNKCPDEDIPV